MSSSKQIWLAVILTMSALFFVTATVSNLSTIRTQEQQLNRDSATSAGAIAYYLQSTTNGDTSLRLQVPPQLDAHLYQLVQLTDFSGTITALRQDNTGRRKPPQWFNRLFPIETTAIAAPIVRGGKELGAITVQSDTALACAMLWGGTLRLAVLQDILVSRNFADDINLPGAATVVHRHEPLKDTFTRLHSVLTAAVANKKSDIYIAGTGEIIVMPVREQLTQWRKIFRQAFTQLNFSLAAFPVAGLEGELLHVEAPARLPWQQQEMTASQFLPWIYRLELACDLDQQIVELALLQIASDSQPVCINLSAGALFDPEFLPWLSEKLDAHAGAARLLWLEVQENAAFNHLDKFATLSVRVRGFGTKIGIEHMGHRLAEFSRLRSVELDYIKIDGTVIRDIDQNRANQIIVRTLCAIAKATDVMSIAEGVNNENEWNRLKALGIDGVTGPGVTLEGNHNPVQTAGRQAQGAADAAS